MASYNEDGHCTVQLSEDKTQVVADIYPPRGVGRDVRVSDVQAKLAKLGIAFGIREAEIERAVEHVANTSIPMKGIIIAQGEVPVDGRDAHIIWKVDESVLKRPLPQLASGQPDYFAYDPARRVEAGDLLATIVPATRGKPGKTVTDPISVVPQREGRPASILAGEGIEVSDDRLRYSAAVSGYAAIVSERLIVKALRIVEEDVARGTYSLSSGAVLLGAVTDAVLTVGGDLAIRGEVVRGSLRVHGQTHLHIATGCRIVADGDIFVLGGLTDCEVMTPGRVVVEGDGAISGGSITSGAGLDAHDLGSADAKSTAVAVGGDQFRSLRLQEIEEEIELAELNVSRIGAALRPHSVAETLRAGEQKRRMLDTLTDQRRRLEQRIRDLHHEKRTLSAASRAHDDRCTASVNVRGTAHPGVWIAFPSAQMRIDNVVSAVTYHVTADGAMCRNPLQEAADRAA